MLEFHYEFNPKQFRVKARQLAHELTVLLSIEQIQILETTEANISTIYKNRLGNKLFNQLNNLYFTIRANTLHKHCLFGKYLPELKHAPHSELLFADVFSGAGGLGQGLVNSGFQPAFVNDIYTDALETYYFNHTLPLTHFLNKDIKEVLNNIDTYRHLFSNIKVLAGGPPCQGFSRANRQRDFEVDETTNEKRFIEDERNKLYKDFVQLIGILKPDFFIMENVSGMMRVERQIEEDIDNAARNINDVTSQKYFFSPLLVNTNRFNIPQNRSRYILIGGKNLFEIEQIKKGIRARERKIRTYKLRDALYGLPEIGTNPFKNKPEYEHENHGLNHRKVSVPQNDFLRELNKQKESCYLFNHRSRYNNENDLEIFRRLPEGENSLHESIRELNNYTNRDHIFKDKYYKLKLDDVSKTITSHMKYDCHMYIHPRQARGLSPREAARLQTFSDDYVFRGPLNSWYKQIGNAVPVKLAEIIGNEIMRFYR